MLIINTNHRIIIIFNVIIIMISVGFFKICFKL